MERFFQMDAAEMMMRLSVLSNSQHGFETGLENYAYAAWDKIVFARNAPKIYDWFRRFGTERDAVFAEIYNWVFA